MDNEGEAAANSVKASNKSEEELNQKEDEKNQIKQSRNLLLNQTDKFQPMSPNVNQDLNKESNGQPAKVKAVCQDFVNAIFTVEKGKLFIEPLDDPIPYNDSNKEMPASLSQKERSKYSPKDIHPRDFKSEHGDEVIAPFHLNYGSFQPSAFQFDIQEPNNEKNVTSSIEINQANSEETNQRNKDQVDHPLSHLNQNTKKDSNVSFKHSEQLSKEESSLSSKNDKSSQKESLSLSKREEIERKGENCQEKLTVKSKQDPEQRSNPELFQQCSNLISNIFDDYSIGNAINEDNVPFEENKKNTSLALSDYNNHEKEIITIQSNWKTYYDKRSIAILKDKSFFIQRSFRKFLIRKYNLPDNFYYNDKFIKLQNDIYEENLKENLSVLFPALFIDKTDLSALASNMLNFSNNPIHNPYETGRINLFAKILDFDMMIESNESYETLWASIFDSIYSKCLKSCAPLQLIAVGGQHTLCVNNKGKIFTFGWNNYGQCGVPVNSTIINKEELNDDYLVEITKYNELKPKIINRVDGIKIPEIDMVIMSNSIACGEDHSLILDQEGAVWAFGLNLNGQLGLGHSRIIEKPTKITELSKQVIVSVKTEGNINFAISNKGDAFMWPWSDKGDIQFTPRKLPLKMGNQKVSSIACGNNFVLILNTGGIVYSMGRTNKFGQLGHGDFNPRLYPSKIEFFVSNSEKITQISCGFKHCMAKSSTGRAYTWGLVRIYVQ